MKFEKNFVIYYTIDIEKIKYESILLVIFFQDLLLWTT